MTTNEKWETGKQRTLKIRSDPQKRLQFSLKGVRVGKTIKENKTEHSLFASLFMFIYFQFESWGKLVIVWLRSINLLSRKVLRIKFARLTRTLGSRSWTRHSTLLGRRFLSNLDDVPSAFT